MPGDALTAIAAELYGLLPDEFTAARNERGRAARGDDRDLAARIQDLKRPSPPAWLVNQLVRHRPSELDAVLELGAELRAAQDDLDAAQLAQLAKQRRQLVSAVAHEAAELAEELGNPVRGPVLDAVAQTLQAAMSDVAASAAVRSGRLVRGLEAVGLEVDLEGAVAGEVDDAGADVPGSGSGPGGRRPRRRAGAVHPVRAAVATTPGPLASRARSAPRGRPRRPATARHVRPRRPSSSPTRHPSSSPNSTHASPSCNARPTSAPPPATSSRRSFGGPKTNSPRSSANCAPSHATVTARPVRRRPRGVRPTTLATRSMRSTGEARGATQENGRDGPLRRGMAPILLSCAGPPAQHQRELARGLTRWERARRTAVSARGRTASSAPARGVRRPARSPHR